MEGLFEQARVRVNLPGSVETPGRGSVPVRVLDLGSTGGIIEHPDCLTAGDTSVLCVCLGGVNVRIRARLRWSYVSKLTGYHEGLDGARLRSWLEFLPLTQASEILLKKYLARPTSPDLQ